MRAGDMNRLITFQRATYTKAANGQKTPTWADAATVWAEVVTTGGKEFYAAQKKNAETSAVFKVRYTLAVNERMQIKYGNRAFEIISLNDVDGKHEELRISAKEVV